MPAGLLGEVLASKSDKFAGASCLSQLRARFLLQAHPRPRATRAQPPPVLC